MLASLLYSIVRLLVDLLSIRDREQAELQAEVLALRHQLRVLQRPVRRPRWRPGDRMVLASLIERIPKRRWSALVPSPETILRCIASSCAASGPCGVHKVRRVRSRTLNRPVNCLGLMEAFARFSSDSDGSNAIEEPRVGFRVRRVVYPVRGTSRHRRLPPAGPSPGSLPFVTAALGRKDSNLQPSDPERCAISLVALSNWVIASGTRIVRWPRV